MGSRYRSRRGQDAVREWCARRLDGWHVAHRRAEIATTAGRTHVVVAGSGTATVLYLPGTNFNAATSLDLASELAAEARVVVADLPGQPGLSSGDRPAGNRRRAYGVWAGEVARWTRTSISPGPLLVAGHSLGAAVALAAPTGTFDALVLVDPAGLVRLRITPEVLGATVPWLLSPTERRSRALLGRMTAPGRHPDPALVEWMTLVGRHTKPTIAPGPLPSAVTDRWRNTPRAVLSGARDCFLPPRVLASAVRDRLDTDLVVLPGLGHLSVDDDPAGLAAAISAVLPTTEDPRR